MVEDLFERASQSYADLQRERNALRAQVEELSGTLTELRAKQSLVQEALVSAHGTAHQVVAQAQDEAERARERALRDAGEIVDNARNRARDVLAEAEVERRRAEQEADRLQLVAGRMRAECRSFVDQALAMLDDGEGSTGSIEDVGETLVTAARQASEG